MSDKMRISNSDISEILKEIGSKKKPKSSEEKKVSEFIVNIKTNGVTKDTAWAYVESFGRSNSAEWLEKNIWSKLNMADLKSLQKAVEEVSDMMKEEHPGSKGFDDCASELTGFVNRQEREAENAKQYAKLPDKIKVYDMNKDGEITEDEVDDLESFAKVIRGMNGDGKKATLESLSAGLRLKLLEMLFKNDEKGKIEKLPYRPGKEHGKPNHLPDILPGIKGKNSKKITPKKPTPLDSNMIKIIKEKMDKDSKSSEEIEK